MTVSFTWFGGKDLTPHQEKLSNYNLDSAKLDINNRNRARKGGNDPLHVTLTCKAMKLWPMKVCLNPG